jgi:hypothetical protein
MMTSVANYSNFCTLRIQLSVRHAISLNLIDIMEHMYVTVVTKIFETLQPRAMDSFR